MDLIIVLAIIVVIVIIRRDFKCFIYSLGVLEIFFRVVHFISDNLKIAPISNLVNTYIPSSMISIFNEYANGLFFYILEWTFVIFMGILDFYLVRYLIKRK